MNVVHRVRDCIIQSLIGVVSMPPKEIREQIQDPFLRHTLFLQGTRESIKRLGRLRRDKRGRKTTDIFGAVHGRLTIALTGARPMAFDMETERRPGVQCRARARPAACLHRACRTPHKGADSAFESNRETS